MRLLELNNKHESRKEDNSSNQDQNDVKQTIESQGKCDARVLGSTTTNFLVSDQTRGLGSLIGID